MEERNLTSYSFATIHFFYIQLILYISYIQLRIKNFVAIAIKIKSQNLKIFYILKLAGVGSWFYEVILAEVLSRFPIKVYNRLEII